VTNITRPEWPVTAWCAGGCGTTVSPRFAGSVTCGDCRNGVPSRARWARVAARDDDGGAMGPILSTPPTPPTSAFTRRESRVDRA